MFVIYCLGDFYKRNLDGFLQKYSNRELSKIYVYVLLAYLVSYKEFKIMDYGQF